MTTEQTMPELLPCPFCGSECSVQNQFGKEYWAQCNDPSCCATDGALYNSPREAVELWNRRPAIAATKQAEPFAWATFDGEGGYDLIQCEGNENYRNEYIKRNGEKYADWVFPLYAAPQPAQRPEQTEDQ